MYYKRFSDLQPMGQPSNQQDGWDELTPINPNIPENEDSVSSEYYSKALWLEASIAKDSENKPTKSFPPKKFQSKKMNVSKYLSGIDSISADIFEINQVTANSTSCDKISASSIYSKNVETDYLSANILDANSLNSNSISSNSISANNAEIDYLSSSIVNFSNGHIESVYSSEITANDLTIEHFPSSDINWTNYDLKNLIVKNDLSSDNLFATNGFISELSSDYISSEHATFSEITVSEISILEIASGSGEINPEYISANTLTADNAEVDAIFVNRPAIAEVFRSDGNYIYGRLVKFGKRKTDTRDSSIIPYEVTLATTMANAVVGDIVSYHDWKTNNDLIQSTGILMNSNDIRNNDDIEAAKKCSYPTIPSDQEGIDAWNEYRELYEGISSTTETVGNDPSAMVIGVSDDVTYPKAVVFSGRTKILSVPPVKKHDYLYLCKGIPGVACADRNTNIAHWSTEIGIALEEVSSTNYLDRVYCEVSGKIGDHDFVSSACLVDSVVQFNIEGFSDTYN